MPLVADDVVYSVLPVPLRGRDRGVTCAATCAACRVDAVLRVPSVARTARVAGAVRALLAQAWTGAVVDGDTRSYVIAGIVA
jgi:hypothetical protein